MPTETSDLGFVDTDLGVQAEKAELENRSARLRRAVRDAGGNQVVAQKAGIPTSTLGAYLAGGEWKLSRVVALAEATGVTLEWLATGRGPMHAGELPAEAAASGGAAGPEGDLVLETGAAQAGDRLGAAPPPEGLFNRINYDRLADAYRGAFQLLARQGHYQPEAKSLLRVTMLLYDEFTAAEAKADPSA